MRESLKPFYKSFYINCKACFLEIARACHKGCYHIRKWKNWGIGINNHWLRKKKIYVVICSCPVFNIWSFILSWNFWLVIASPDAPFYWANYKTHLQPGRSTLQFSQLSSQTESSGYKFKYLQLMRKMKYTHTHLPLADQWTCISFALLPFRGAQNKSR